MTLQQRYNEIKSEHQKDGYGLSDFICLARAVHEVNASHRDTLKIFKQIAQDDYAEREKLQIKMWLKSIGKDGLTKPRIGTRKTRGVKSR